MAAIRANSVLPARREPLTLTTADGLRLVGELAKPLGHDPVATLVCLHPLPTHGGMMDSHVFRKAAYRLPALAGIAVLRFNTRGTSSVQGTSEGSFDNADGERFDVAAAIEYAEFAELPDIWLLAWSFGTDLALMHGCDPAVRGAILMSPPLRFGTDEDMVGRSRPSRCWRWCPSTTTICAHPRHESASPGCRRPRSWGWRGPSTCGWETPRPLSTSSSSGCCPGTGRCHVSGAAR